MSAWKEWYLTGSKEAYDEFERECNREAALDREILERDFYDFDDECEEEE